MSQRAIGFSALALWLFVPWSLWVDRHRDATITPATPSLTH
jgi:hypothetical protein